MAYIENKNQQSKLSVNTKSEEFVPTQSEPTPFDTLVIPDITSKVINKTFGHRDDYIELHIYNNNNQVIYSENNFEDYTIPSDQTIKPPLTNTLSFDTTKILNDRGFYSGRYTIKLNILKKKIFSTNLSPFLIKEISSDRRELRTITTKINNNILGPAVSKFIADIESSAYFKEFSLNFGNDLLVPAVNILLNKDTDKYEVLIKSLNPLPSTIGQNTTFKVVEEITDSMLIAIDLGDIDLIDEGIPMAGPNFHIDTRLNSSIPSEFKTYDQILNYNVTSSYQHLLSKLEDNTIDLNIKYDSIRPISESSIETSYHFENFTHFSSAVERLKNFEYKLKLIESYDDQILSLNSITGDTLNSSHVISNKSDLNNKKTTLIKGFDGYEQFLYFTSGTYAWPKQNTEKPFTLYSVTSSEATVWLGNEFDYAPTGSGQLLSASLYDKENIYNLNKLVPNHIIENSNNSIYLSFVNMIGQHFDHIWTYIKSLSNLNNADNFQGISKDLVYFKLKDIGIEVFDQFENSNLLEYILGESVSGSNSYGGDHFFNYSSEHPSSSLGFGLAVSASEAIVTASNEGSTPKGDIAKEIWKRIYHNAPYLLKTKGTERGIKALMSCYGLPSTILNIKEYGGSTVTSGPFKNLNDSEIYKTFSYEKTGFYLNSPINLPNTSNENFLVRFPWEDNDLGPFTEKTIEFRLLPAKGQSANVLTLSDSTNTTLTPGLKISMSPYTGNDISSSGDASTYGNLKLTRNGVTLLTTENFALYNGNFWNIHLIGVSGSTAEGTSKLQLSAYQTNHLKHTTKIIKSTTFASYESDFGKDSGQGKTYLYVGGPTFKGGIQEVRCHWGEALTDETLTKHSLEPFMYSGNTISSSFSNLIIRLPLGSTGVETLENHPPDTSLKHANTLAVTNPNSNYLEFTETHHLPTPDTVGISTTSEKVRIDEGTVDDNLLSLFVKGETSTLDRQPQDFEDLGIFFSPTNEINEDIIYTLGSFRLDDYIGSPLTSVQSASEYSDLKDIKDIYFQKIKNRYNYWDYIKQIQYIDHTLFKMIEQFVPARANTKTGLLIEPHILERTKFKRTIPQRTDGQTMTEGLHQTFEGEMNRKVYTIRSSSATDFGQKGLDGINNIEGQHDPGSYVIFHSNQSFTTSSKGERKEKGTNATIDVYDDHINPSNIDPNRENQQSSQAPIKPFNPTTGKPAGYKAHESSVLLGNIIGGRKSNKYYQYKEYRLTTSSLY